YCSGVSRALHSASDRVTLSLMSVLLDTSWRRRAPRPDPRAGALPRSRPRSSFGELRASCPHRGSLITGGWGATRRAPGRPGGAERLERETGFEPATPTLARLCSTPELFPPDAHGF